MYYLRMIATLIIFVMFLAVIAYRIFVLFSRKHDKKEKISAGIELLMISCFLIIILG